MDGRIIGIDFGTKRVGLAIADPLGMFAQPLGTHSPDEALAELVRIRDHEGIDRIVIGWPLLPDGGEGWMTDRVTEYINRIRKILPETDVIKWDERDSTELAREMIKSGTKPSLRSTGRGRIDTAAAGIILQQYLDEAKTE
jgi:putative Holliday junction resolvase